MDKQLLRILSSELELASTDDSDDDSVIRRNEDDLATDFLFRDSYIDDRDLGRERRIVQYSGNTFFIVVLFLIFSMQLLRGFWIFFIHAFILKFCMLECTVLTVL